MTEDIYKVLPDAEAAYVAAEFFALCKEFSSKEEMYNQLRVFEKAWISCKEFYDVEGLDVNAKN